MRRGAILAVAGAVTMGGAAAAQEPLPLTGELQVNSFTTGSQSAPKVAMADDGNHVVVWTSDLADGDGAGIRFRKFPGDGSAPFNESGTNQETTGDQIRPGLAMNPSRDFVVVWESEVANRGIRARRTGNSGTTFGSEFDASVTTFSSTQFPEVDRAPGGEFVVVWEGGGDTSFRLFDAGGDPATGDVEVAPGLGDSRGPAVCFLAGGDFVVVFHSSDAGDLDILAQPFDENGIAIGQPIPLETSAADQRFASVAALADGGFVVAWQDGALGAAVRRFDAAGSPLGDAQTADLPGSQVAVAASPDGPFVVVLRGTEIRAREFDRLGHPVGGAFTVNTTTAGLQSAPHVAAGSDRFVVAWETEGLDGDGFGIARRLFRFRSVFADDFETGDAGGWSAVTP